MLLWDLHIHIQGIEFPTTNWSKCVLALLTWAAVDEIVASGNVADADKIS